MLNYLAREGYLRPFYGRSGRRGAIRYYSFRDLVIARIVKKLLDAGLEIRRLKTGITKLQTIAGWAGEEGESQLRMLATDGRKLFFIEHGGTIRDLTNDGQLAFAFVLDVAKAHDEIRTQLTEDQLRYFTLTNKPLLYA
jgi:DNA-binding transcriptional MerR regulator